MDAITTDTLDRVASLPLRDDERASLDDPRRAALRTALGAFFSSRLIVWAAGIAAVLIWGWQPGMVGALDPVHLTQPFGHALPNLLVSPAARWDSAWYLGIARTGYVLNAQAVFFPFYPALIALGSTIVGNGLAVVVGIVISWVAGIAALFVMHRLVALDFNEELARNTVWIFAWLPTATVLSAVYPEALFILLVLGCFFSARLGRWALAGALGGIAAATRNGGILLLAPLLVLYLYGPRADREPDLPAAGLRPRYLVRRDVLWFALIPLGLLAYIGFLAVTTGHPFSPFTKQAHWGRYFLPLGAIPLGIWSVLKAIYAASYIEPHLSNHVTIAAQSRHVMEFAFLAVSLWLLRVCWKRLPFAYTSFAAVSLAMALSVPATHNALKSFPRFTLPMFPLWIALALWATERRRVRQVIAVSAPLLAIFTILFVNWTWPP